MIYKIGEMHIPFNFWNDGYMYQVPKTYLEHLIKVVYQAIDQQILGTV